MRTAGPVLCEIVGDMRFDEIPKCVSSVNAQGERVSADLENPWPCLDPAEMDAIYARLPQ
jgi:acetolactate synthase-1/2/3 large subunit